MGLDSGGYEEIEHTADIGLRVWAEDLPGVFERAAEGFIGLLLDPETVEPERTVQISADGADAEELLVGWLEDILFAFDARRFAPAGAEVTSFSETEMTGRLAGQGFDPDRHETRNAIKAVTYHDLKIEKSDRGYEVRIFFDV
ncbi:MAG: archease [Planctomycetota bacterium]